MKLVSFRVYRQVVIVRVVDTRCGNGAIPFGVERNESDERVRCKDRCGAFVNHGHKVSIRR